MRGKKACRRHLGTGHTGDRCFVYLVRRRDRGQHVAVAEFEVMASRAGVLCNRKPVREMVRDFWKRYRFPD